MLASGLALAPCARAETLADALALAYQSNPQLQSERASLRALDETYVQARAAYGPSVSLSLEADYSKAQSFGFLGPDGRRSDTRSNSVAPTLSATQLLYNGGRTAAQVSAAEADILSERERLRQIEAQILLQVIDSYLSVLRDESLLSIRLDALAAFDRAFVEAKARLAAGDATLTDVGQTESQLGSARADVSAARGQLQTSRAAYRAVVGQEPTSLTPFADLPGLPKTVDEAFDQAERDNPDLNRAILADRAARERIREAKAQSLPQVSARATYGYQGSGSDFYLPQYNRQVTGTLTLTQPLFTAGSIRSQIRQAAEQEASARIDIETARRTAIQGVSQAWNQAAAAGEERGSAQEAVRGATLSVEGARKEYEAGLRSTLEVLIEQQRYRDARIVLAQIEYAAAIAQAQLLSAEGSLNISRLSGSIPVYDPKLHFARVRHAGALPWEPVVAAIDTELGPRDPSPERLRAPPPATTPTGLRPARDLPPGAGAYAATAPTSGLPGSTAPNTPKRIDSAASLAPVFPPP